MEYIIIGICILTMLIVVAIVYNVNIRKFKKFVKEQEKEYKKLQERFPANIDICKYILKKIKNEKVKIEEDKMSSTCLYIAITDKIVIADVKDSYTRIQTIAHECLHSIQDRKILLFNFIFSNIYLLYFIITTIFAIIGILPYKTIFLIIMILFSYLYYFIRSYLENDAMIKARFLAKEYMEETKIFNNEEIGQLISGYDKLNLWGIKIVNYNLFFETLIKILIMLIAFFIRH